MLNDVLILLGAYLIGSIPFGLVFTFIAGHGDIRQIGSGNIGTTNVLRTGSKLLAILTLISDSGKIIFAMILAKSLGFADEYIVGSISFIGHLFPIWLRFKGGKGVASFLGLSIYLFPKIAAILAGTWILTFFTTRYSSLAALIAALVGIAYFIFFLPFGNELYLMLALIILILIKHKSNIQRLLNGQESKFFTK